MYWFYFIALLPIVAGGLVFFKNHRVVWQEWLAASALALLCAICFNVASYYSAVGDVRTLSGEVTSVTRIPRWQEYYEEAVYRTEYYTTTDSKGNTTTHSREVFDHWEPETCWHEEQRTADSNIGTSDSISRPHYDEIHAKFGKETSVYKSHSTWSHASKQIGGDYHDYSLVNVKNAIVPVVKNDHWVNKLKLDNTVYAFAPVPMDVSMPEYPECTARFNGNRLIGTGFDFTNEDLDKVNAKVGYEKHCNLIIVNFPYGTPDQYNEYLRSAWRGGKSNDFIIVTAGKPQSPTWTRIISWSDSEISKVRIGNIVRDNGITKETLPLIKKEIDYNFKPRDWSEFDVISVEPDFSYIGWYIFALLITQAGLWYYIVVNEYQQGDTPFDTLNTDHVSRRYKRNGFTFVNRR